MIIKHRAVAGIAAALSLLVLAETPSCGKPVGEQENVIPLTPEEAAPTAEARELTNADPVSPTACNEDERFIEMRFIGDRGNDHYVIDDYHFGSIHASRVEINGDWHIYGCLPLGAGVDIWVTGGGTAQTGYGYKLCFVYEEGKTVDYSQDGTGQWPTISCEHIVGEPL